MFVIPQVCVIALLGQGKDTSSYFYNLGSIVTIVQHEKRSCANESQGSYYEAENKNKTITDIAQTLGLPKSTVWKIIKKKECTGELCNCKRTARTEESSLW